MSAVVVLGVCGFLVGMLVFVVGLADPQPQGEHRPAAARLRDLLPSLAAGDEANLRLAGVTAEAYSVQRFGGGVVGLVVGTAIAVVAGRGVVGIVGLAVLAATMGWVLPMLGLRDTARKAREEFDHVVRVWIALVAQQVRAGADPTAAMLRAAQAGRRPAWQILHRFLLAAQQSRRPAWEGLADIVERYGIHSLAPAVSALGLAAQRGTRVADAVLVAADSLWREAVARERERTAKRAQIIVVPATLVALALAAILIYPPFTALTGGPVANLP